MLFGLLGCGRSRAPEAVVQQYLQKKYGEVFEVGPLQRTRSNTFQNRKYTGVAWLKGQPAYTFDVWLSKDYKQVHDSYYVLQMLPAVDEWVRREAKTVWDICQVRDEIEIMAYNDGASYNETQLAAFFEQEELSHGIALALPSDTLAEPEVLAGEIRTFLDKLAWAGNGTIRIYFVPEVQWDSVDIYQLPTHREADIATGMLAQEALLIELLKKVEVQGSGG